MIKLKKFVDPELEIKKFSVEDVITTSTEEPIDPDQGEII